MKKKIKNLKLEEAVEICITHKCDNCPFGIDKNCGLLSKEDFDKIKESKVEVNE